MNKLEDLLLTNVNLKSHIMALKFSWYQLLYLLPGCTLITAATSRSHPQSESDRTGLILFGSTGKRTGISIYHQHLCTKIYKDLNLYNSVGITELRLF